MAVNEVPISKKDAVDVARKSIEKAIKALNQAFNEVGYICSLSDGFEHRYFATLLYSIDNITRMLEGIKLELENVEKEL